MEKILVIDDDEDILFVVEYFLRSEGYLVHIINTAEKVFQEIKEFAPDLILLDINLRGSSGIDICREIKAIKQFEHTPVVLFSAGGEINKLYKDCQSSGFISKPFDLPDLLNKIKGFLSNHNISGKSCA